MKINKSILAMSAAITMLAACSENEPLDEQQGNTEEEVAFDGAEQAFFTKKGEIKSGYFEGQKIFYEAIDGENVFEGDIIIPKDHLHNSEENFVLQNGQDANLSKSVGRTSGRWPNNTVYYTIDSGLPNQSRVTNAIASWEANTSLRFVQRTNQSNYITFRSGSGCSSSVGMVGGRQYINLASGCSTGNTIHEIGHAVGLWHEQSRADRNNYITINFQNIQDGRDFNFRTYVEQGYDGDEYTSTLDLGSIMMYGSYSFSKNGQPTITRKDGSTYSIQRNALSTQDLQGIAQMYPGDGGGGEPQYENGNYYTVYGLRVYRYNNQWWYYSSANGWRQVVYTNGAWYYA